MWKHKKTSLLYIVCNMGFKNKTRVKSFSCSSIANWVVIKEKNSHMFCVYFSLCKLYN